MHEVDRVEYRWYPRVKVDVPALWGLTEDCPREARMTSLSVNGCFLQTDRIEPHGAQIYVRLPASEQMVLRAEIRYHLEGIGIGMKFKDLTDDQAQLLDEYFEALRSEMEVCREVV